MAGVNLTERDGHQLAADMLRALGAHWNRREDDALECGVHVNWPGDHSEILRRHLSTVSAAGSPELERGFFAVVTDFIGSSVGGVVPEPEFYLSDEVAANGGD